MSAKQPFDAMGKTLELILACHPMRSFLMELPRELRDRIYMFLLRTCHEDLSAMRNSMVVESPTVFYALAQRSSKSRAMLLVNKQVNIEYIEAVIRHCKLVSRWEHRGEYLIRLFTQRAFKNNYSRLPARKPGSSSFTSYLRNVEVQVGVNYTPHGFDCRDVTMLRSATVDALRGMPSLKELTMRLVVTDVSIFHHPAFQDAVKCFLDFQPWKRSSIIKLIKRVTTHFESNAYKQVFEVKERVDRLNKITGQFEKESEYERDFNYWKFYHSVVSKNVPLYKHNLVHASFAEAHTRIQEMYDSWLALGSPDHVLGVKLGDGKV